MHEVQAFSFFGVRPITARTVWMLGFQRRLVRRCECETLLPKPGPLPQTSQLAATGHSKDFRCTYGEIPTGRVHGLYRRRQERNGPIFIGQPEQHTTTAPVERNYHAAPGTRPAPGAGARLLCGASRDPGGRCALPARRRRGTRLVRAGPGIARPA